MRIYEIIFILKPEVTEEDTDKFIALMEGVVTSTGGTMRRVEKMGIRRLAYMIGHHRDGQYVLFSVNGEAATVKEFERRLRVSEQIIKFLTVRVDLDMKRYEKLQAIRSKKLAKKKPRGGQSQGQQSQGSGSEAAAASA
jgi:small subunit ribosomal protein S6